MVKANPGGESVLPDPEVVSRVGTLWMKTSTQVCVLDSAGDFYLMEYKPRFVQAGWKEGMLIRVYRTQEFRSKIVAMEEVEPTSGGQDDRRQKT